VALSGKLTAIETQPCEGGTGSGVIGTHIVLKTDEGAVLNIDLGWAKAVEPTVKQLAIGKTLEVTAFRTDKMPKGRYVAKSLTFDSKTVQLRDENLRPFWAGRGPGWYGSENDSIYPIGPGPGRGRGWDGRRGRGWGRGRGRGWGGGRGHGWGRGGQWWAAPSQRGPATPEQRPSTAGKVAVTAAGPSMDAAIDPRFGRCRYFLLVDTERETFEVVENTQTTRNNAGAQAAEIIAGKGAQVLLTGECGPKASKALAAAGIEVIPGCSGTVGALIRQFKAGQLAPASKTQAVPDSASGEVPGVGRRRP